MFPNSNPLAPDLPPSKKYLPAPKASSSPLLHPIKGGGSAAIIHMRGRHIGRGAIIHIEIWGQWWLSSSQSNRSTPADRTRTKPCRFFLCCCCLLCHCIGCWCCLHWQIHTYTEQIISPWPKPCSLRTGQWLLGQNRPIFRDKSWGGVGGVIRVILLFAIWCIGSFASLEMVRTASLSPLQPLYTRRLTQSAFLFTIACSLERRTGIPRWPVTTIYGL